ncbi:hypothetical protein V9T40_004355 [Parthenolecanium corni]|uniref:Mannosyltransferase n=1 Tax=Parthenolecanium corni TaxID=536013 RepID=A0AAN9YAP0_9HEMI
MRYKYLPLLIICIILRLCCLISRNSFYVADEYWQSLEVAHKLVFGYGYLTWEWVYGIRSYIYVGWIALLYKILKVLRWDSVRNLTLLPCIVQAVFTAISDTYFIAWIHKVSKSSRQAYWSVWCYMTNVFLAYCATRTLTNVAETNLTCIALYHYPWFKRQSGSVLYLWFVCVACVMRPTAAIQWTPLCFFALKECSSPVKTLFSKYIPIGLVVLISSTFLDSYFYGRLQLTWWNFLEFNVFHNVSANYSVQSLYWYFVLGLPVVLGPCIVPFYTAIASQMKDNIIDDIFSKVYQTVMFSLVLYSFIPHKEFRFVLPLCPLMVFVASYPISQWTVSLKKIYTYMLSTSVLLVSLFVFYYLSYQHQVATVKVMQHLNSPRNNLLFLMPCHLTPLYSHLHTNIPTRFLRCDPNLKNDANYVEESVEFYRNPSLWLEKEYSFGQRRRPLPSHIICFTSLVPIIKNFLNSNHYELWLQLYHGDFVPPKTGNHLLVFNRTALFEHT